MPMLELQGLTRRFGAVTAVDAVSLRVPDGQMVGVIGRSGAGKSTLLRMVNRLCDPSAGRILHDGRDVTALRGPALRRLAHRLRHDLPAVQPGPPARRHDQRAGRPAEPRAGLAVAWRGSGRRPTAPSRSRRWSSSISAGSRRSGPTACRAASSSAWRSPAPWCRSPSIILADEPVASLDPRNAAAGDGRAGGDQPQPRHHRAGQHPFARPRPALLRTAGRARRRAAGLRRAARGADRGCRAPALWAGSGRGGRSRTLHRGSTPSPEPSTETPTHVQPPQPARRRHDAGRRPDPVARNPGKPPIPSWSSR